jgi:menaquinone-9 beta-reductase
METYDVVIVGGSCAGAAAAYTLSKSNRKVVIVDKAVFPRKKLCGGLLTEKAVSMLKEIYGDIAPDNFVLLSSSAFGIYHADLGKICKYTDSADRLFAVDRAGFDHYFLEKAASAGCKILCGQTVRETGPGRVVLNNGQVLSGDFIIGADGPHSIVRKAVSPDIKKADYAIGIEADVPYEHLKCFNDEDGIYPQIYFGFINAGYGWVFPKPSFVTVGLGGLTHPNAKSLKDHFRLFLRHLLKHEGMIPERLKGFPIPFHNFIKKPGKGNILLVGDAAGLVEPITGEGMYFAMLSGKLAAEAILSQRDPVKAYNEAVNKKIHPLFRQAYWMRRAFYHRRMSLYAMRKMRSNAKYCKYYLELISGTIDYKGYLRLILKDRNHYPCA